MAETWHDNPVRSLYVTGHPSSVLPCQPAPGIPIASPVSLCQRRGAASQVHEEILQQYQRSLEALSSKATMLSSAAAAASMGLPAQPDSSAAVDAAALLGSCLQALQGLLALEAWAAMLSLQQQVGQCRLGGAAWLPGAQCGGGTGVATRLLAAVEGCLLFPLLHAGSKLSLCPHQTWTRADFLRILG